MNPRPRKQQHGNYNLDFSSSRRKQVFMVMEFQISLEFGHNLKTTTIIKHGSKIFTHFPIQSQHWNCFYPCSSAKLLSWRFSCSDWPSGKGVTEGNTIFPALVTGNITGLAVIKVHQVPGRRFSEGHLLAPPTKMEPQVVLATNMELVQASTANMELQVLATNMELLTTNLELRVPTTNMEPQSDPRDILPTQDFLISNPRT